ncbi:MAG TPA: type II secretion system F family protein [Rhodocyclaceae bacterium]|jgi:type IV pilus assembly protein PilC|nr:type II secretion system F family protein [Betaproteobacteria bacterium]HMV00839.1 type II secretion system F family protein [Rhodocyclaceae bacterium]HMV20240.1 type II secretion system F family protein [Rhodocyclaceae bacterium]HMW78317.1 type II secretion system F family protein [Rhodocyclaceae bacterium]HNE43841.1 type II secretion system F family protein [Rhodocyclaceae bacterium]
MLFEYKAVSAEGRRVFGRIDAVNLIDLEMRLKRMDLDLITGQPILYRSLFGGGRIPRRELINFCFHLEQLTASGVAILDGLADLRDSLEHPRFREIVAGVIESIEGGQTLSQALSSHPNVFSQVFVSLIRAGEASGDLPQVLASLTESLKWEDELAAHTKKLMLYPAFVGTVVLTATTFLMLYLVPQLKVFVRNMGQSLPPQTKLLFFVSDTLITFWPLLIAIPVVAALGLQVAVQSNPLTRIWLDGVILRLPVVGEILKKIALSRFAGTFAMLYASGIPVLESIRSTQDVVGNRIVRQALEKVEVAIREGKNVTQAFRDVGLFPPLIIRMLRVGENTGSLDRALRNVSYFYNRDVRESVERSQALIEPMLTLLLGALLGWIMLSVIGPIYDVISRLKT